MYTSGGILCPSKLTENSCGCPCSLCVVLHIFKNMIFQSWSSWWITNNNKHLIIKHRWSKQNYSRQYYSFHITPRSPHHHHPSTINHTSLTHGDISYINRNTLRWHMVTFHTQTETHFADTWWHFIHKQKHTSLTHGDISYINRNTLHWRMVTFHT